MAGVIAIAIENGNVQIKMKLEGLNVGELSLVSAQLRIINNKILSEIERLIR